MRLEKAVSKMRLKPLFLVDHNVIKEQCQFNGISIFEGADVLNFDHLVLEALPMYVFTMTSTIFVRKLMMVFI